MSLATSAVHQPLLDAWRHRAFWAGAVGLMVCAFGLLVGPTYSLRAYHVAYLYFLGIALGSLALLMLQYLTGGVWGVVLRPYFDAAIRTLPKPKRPKRVLGCEIWRDLDWLRDQDKQVLPVDRHKNLAAALNGVFDSQITGGKRYDAAVAGRRMAHATFFESHATDKVDALNFAIRQAKSEGKAVIIMAHRPGGIAECDTILIMEGGMAKAFGPRDEVLKANVRNYAQVAGRIRGQEAQA